MQDGRAKGSGVVRFESFESADKAVGKIYWLLCRIFMRGQLTAHARFWRFLTLYFAVVVVVVDVVVAMMLIAKFNGYNYGGRSLEITYDR
jgi:hypothetical protein